MHALSKTTRGRTSMLTGFINIEEVSQRTGCKPEATWKRRRPSLLGVFAKEKWVYGVLDRDTLRCFHRLVDIKHNFAPYKVIRLDLQSTLVAERQSVVVKSRKSGQSFRIRVHAGSSSSFLQWVTALYLARLDTPFASPLHMGESSSVSDEDDESELAKRSKRVTFSEHNSEYSHTDDYFRTETDGRATVDLGELFYTRDDFDRFSRESRSTMKKENAKTKRNVVRSIVGLLKGN